MSFHTWMSTYVLQISPILRAEDLFVDEQKGQKSVRVGNGAVRHLQLDIYGELVDSIYLAQKLSKPCELPSSFTLLRDRHRPDHDAVTLQ